MKVYSEYRQTGVGKSKYGVTGDPLFTGHVTQPNFGAKISSVLFAAVKEVCKSIKN